LGCGGKRRKQGCGEQAQVGDVGGMDGFIEAGVFYGCSDDGPAGVRAGYAGDYIYGFCAEDDAKRQRRRNGYGKHLSFDRLYGESAAGGPGARAVDEGGGLDRSG
jgi:hypothetical protein